MKIKQRAFIRKALTVAMLAAVPFFAVGGSAVAKSTLSKWGTGGLLYFASYGHTGAEADIALQNPYIIGAVLCVNWSQIEAKKGKYDWSYIDSFLARWSAAGKKVAIRVQWSSSGYFPDPIAKRVTPQWVWNEGARFFYDKPSDTEIPLFWDPIYFRNAINFMKALNARYENNPGILFVFITPGYETNPCHVMKTAGGNPDFLDQYEQMQDSRGTSYTPELWRQTCKEWIEQCAGIFKKLPMVISLNRGGLRDSEDNFEFIGQCAVDHGVMPGQNGIKADSYNDPNGGRYKLFKIWGREVPLFFEMVMFAESVERGTGTLQGVMEAAQRINCAFLNVYAIDVVKGTNIPGNKKYDPRWESALQYGQKVIKVNVDD